MDRPGAVVPRLRRLRQYRSRGLTEKEERTDAPPEVRCEVKE